jgi:hypothetical protein
MTNEIKSNKNEGDSLKSEILSLKKYIEINDQPLVDINEMQKTYFD